MPDPRRIAETGAWLSGGGDPTEPLPLPLAEVVEAIPRDGMPGPRDLSARDYEDRPRP